MAAGTVKRVLNRGATEQGSRSWFQFDAKRVVNKSTGQTDTEVWVYDEIGYWGVTAQDFARELKDVDSDTITVRLNSPGGEVYDGIAIMNALIGHDAKVIVRIDALAASIATVIAMAGDEVIVGSHSEMMIHDASTVAVGNAAEVREVAEMLDRVSANIAEVYAERSGGKADDWRDLMLAETWFSAEEAVAAGLADSVAPKPKPRGGSDEDGEDVDDQAGTHPVLLRRWDLTAHHYKYKGRREAGAPALAQLRAGGASKKTIPDVEETPVEDEDAATCEHGVAMTEACTEGDCERDAVTPEEPEQLDDQVEDLDFGALFTEALGAALVDLTASTDGIDPEIFHHAVRGVTDAAVPTPPRPEPVRTAPPVAPVFPADSVEAVADPEDEGIDPEVFRAAVALAANSAPAVVPNSPEPYNTDSDDPFVIDPTEFYNSLREAINQ